MVASTPERLVKTFIKIRDARAEAKRVWEEQDRELGAKMETIETYMLDVMNKGGIEKFSTGAGTAYRTEKLTPGASDWAAFYAWVREHDAFDFLFKRISGTAVKDYMDQHDGEVPPGVTVYTRYGVAIRRKG